MIHADKVIAIIAAIGGLAASAYYLLVLWSARSYLKTRSANKSAADDAASFLPPVSILKPLKGVDPEIYESFRSHCRQDYPRYEIIFGVSDSDDPALQSVSRLQKEFPDATIHLVICTEKLGPNTKVSNLVQMLQSAQHDYLIVNDSDIRVENDYLRRVMGPLSAPKVGMVTCLYRGIAASTFGSKLESLGISTDFSAGVLAARQVEGGIKFGLGSTLVFRRRDLDAIGGFESLVDYLADDYELGKRLSDRGLNIYLSDVVVETFLPAYGFRGFLDHQLRWGRGMRASRAGGYAGLLFTFGLPWAVLALIASRGAAWAWALAALLVTLRGWSAWVVGHRVLKDRQLGSLGHLLPVRDFVAVLVWFGAFAGNHITWRGDRFRLQNGKLVRFDS
jgi:ceramide glucosyltransferase